jgi:recombinational DNA repair ATPase RecF
MLTRITTRDVEPADLDVALAPRLNLLAGDNGLGKTFLLDLAWFALTGTSGEGSPQRMAPCAATA